MQGGITLQNIQHLLQLFSISDPSPVNQSVWIVHVVQIDANIVLL